MILLFGFVCIVLAQQRQETNLGCDYYTPVPLFVASDCATCNRYMENGLNCTWCLGEKVPLFGQVPLCTRLGSNDSMVTKNLCQPAGYCPPTMGSFFFDFFLNF